MGEPQVEEIAIIGMAGAFPGADTIYELWDNLINKKECIATLSDEELMQAGVPPSEYQNPKYVRRGGFLKNAECFDNEFFKISPREAEILDPQHRVLLEHAWLALEDAGYIPDEIQAPVGVFVGSSVNRYLESKDRWTHPPAAGDYQVMLANEKDFLATRISYKLNLKGPSVNVQSACSTSLLAVGLACKSLLNYECDMAIAGGATVAAPRKRGYTYREGMIYSKTGHCRPFDNLADGTIFSEGVAIVCLKRLSEAVREHDHIYAVIKSAAINNDGNGKIGFTAPSIDGQIEAIRLAHALADVTPAEIGFVETHGTGTHLGDSVEIAALKEVFDHAAGGQTPCYLGAVKANLGHLDVAAGVTGLIKAALAVNKGIIPPVVNFNEPIPELGRANSPFRINQDIVRWDTQNSGRLAGVSSFGVGGTNVHAIVAPPPPVEPCPENPSEVVLLSARRANELQTLKHQLKKQLLAQNDDAFRDIAYTLRECRKSFPYRWGCTARSKAELVEKLEDPEDPIGKASPQKIVFLFPGKCKNISGLATSFYDQLPAFSHWIDRGIEIAQPFFDASLGDLLLNASNGGDSIKPKLADPILFIFEFALAQALLTMGITPDRLYGSSLGEYVAACVSGVMTFEDALHVVIKRADVMQTAPQAEIPAVSLSEFRKDLESIPFQPATVPFVSNVSGTWITDEIDWQDYWVKHLARSPDINACFNTLLKEDSLFLEISPNSELSAFLQTTGRKKAAIALSCQITPTREGIIPFHDSLVAFWQNGCSIDWTQWLKAKARRVSLPGYPFKKNPFWMITRTDGFHTAGQAPSDHASAATEAPIDDPVSRVVTRIWQDFFRIDKIPPDQDFFTLGGDSLMGLGLVEEINSRLKLKLTFGELVLHPTLGALIEYIGSFEERHAPDYRFSMLFPVQPKGTRPPLFLVAGAHANRYFDIESMKSSYEDDFLSYFSMLVRSLGMDQPIYGFRPKGLLLEEKPHANVQQMAEHYIQALKRIQPQGPYFIGGECIGGVVAYEMAVQLQRSGEQVAQLIMMDTARPTFLFQMKEEYRRFRRNIRKAIKKTIAYLGSPDKKRLLQKIIPWTSLALSVALPITRNQRMKRRVAIGSYQYWRKLLQYRPKGYQGTVTFIVNEQWNKQMFLLGWTKELGARVSIEVVPGGHVERMKVYGDISGRILKNAIDQALLEYGLPGYRASKN